MYSFYAVSIYTRLIQQRCGSAI